MSDESLESENNQQFLWNLLADDQGIKINEKFILKLTKGSRNVNKEVKDSCKVLHFSSEWNFEEVLLIIDGLDLKDYPQLFIFIIETTNFGFTVENQQDLYNKVTNLQEKLLKFGATRPMILQLTAEDESDTIIYFKEETSNKFTVIEQQQDESENSSAFQSFLYSFFNGNFNNSEIEVLNAVREFKNCSLILRFLHTLQLSDGFFGTLVFDLATEGTKAEFLAALDAPFDSNGRVLDYRAQQYISDVFGDDDDPENIDSVFLTAINNENKEVTDYLITYWTHLIQQLPFEQQVKISTAAFETNQLDVLCDLVDIADYPFPDNFKLESIEHDRLCKITAERINFIAAIKTENFDKIDEFIKNNPNLKSIYNSSNKSALTEAVNLKKFAVFYYLKSLGFKGEKCDEILSKLNKEEKEQAVKLATNQRKKNVTKSEYIAPKSVMLLSMRSSVHNSRTEKIQASKYRDKIMKWFTDIHKAAPELIDVAASCNNLKIIFDFESDSVENMSFQGPGTLGSMYPSSKWIFVGAKLSDRNGNVTNHRDQKIKGVLAHELCHYVMKLVYENQEKPYFNDREDLKNMFEEIVKIIDKWSAKDSECPDDECNEIISSVFTLYDPKDFHPELIVRVVQILSEFDDNEDKLKHLQEKYKVFFNFWHGKVIPELQKYLQKNQEVVRLNGTFELLPSILKLKQEFRNGNEVEKITSNKIVVVKTNVPKLLFLNIHKYLHKKVGNLVDSQNIFVDPEKLKNQQHLDDFKQICLENQELSIFVDCTCQIPDGLGNILVNKELNFIFIVSSELQFDKLNKIFKEQEINNAQKLEINYNWSDLTEESQKLMLETKINFQNNNEITLKDLIQIDSKASEATTSKGIENDINVLFDDQLLNLILENHQVNINSSEKVENSEKYFQLLFKPRNFIKKTKMTNDEDKLEIKNGNSDSNDEKPSRFFGKILYSIFGTKKSETSNLNQSKFKEQKASKDQLLSDVKNQQYVLISDQAGNGKSWAIKNFSKILREENPTHWVTYVDLKQFIDEFKVQEGEPEFSIFMAENILKLEKKFEAKIFQKMYENGKVFILFDGFDEIAPNCAEFVSKLAQKFQQNGGNQLWIATRDYFEVDLKEKLKLDVAYRLDEMTENEGVDLIARSWVFVYLKMNNKMPESREEFEECIKMSSNIDIYEQKARLVVKKAFISRNNPVGRPQLFKMIADGFKDEENVGDLQGSKIYVKFIKILYKRWSEQKGQIRNEASIDSQEFEMNFYRFHQYHAIKSLFPELAAILFPGYDGSEWPEEEVIACGILTKRNGKYYFLHETFREYFVAEAIAKALRMIKIERKVIKFVNEILSVEKFKIIRIFIFPVLNEKLVLEKFKPKIQRLILSENKIFSEVFIENHENLADFAIESLKNGKYKLMKSVLIKNIDLIFTNAQCSKVLLKFRYFVFDFLKIDDLKKLIIEQEVMQKVVRLGLEIEVFEDLLTKLEAKTDREFIRQVLMHVKFEYRRGNIFHYLSAFLNLSARKVNKFLEIMEKYFTDNEIFELMSKCNDYEESILEVCVEMENKENFIILWTEIEKYFSVKKFPQNFEDFIKGKNKRTHVLFGAAQCNNIDIHETLWEYLFIIFEDREEFKEFILRKYGYNGNNFVHALVSFNKNPAIIEWTFQIIRDNFSEVQFQVILTSKGHDEMNSIQCAARWSKVVEVHQFLWKFFRDFCGTDEKFLEMLKEVDEDGQNILHIAASREEIETQKTLWEFLLKTIKDREELKDFILQKDNYGKNFVHALVKENRNPAIIELTFKIIRENFSEDQFQEILKSKGRNEMNLLQSAGWNSYFTEVYQYVWKFLRDFYGTDEKFLEILKEVDKDGQNILHFAASRNKIEVQETLWEFLLKTIKDREELKDFVLQKDKYGNNFVHVLVNRNDNPAIIEWTFQIIRENFSEVQFQEILKSKGRNEMNLLQSTAKFLEMLKEVDEHGQNILHFAAIGSIHSTGEVFEFLIQELEKIASRDEIRDMLSNLDNENQNLLQTAAMLNWKSEFHQTLWKTLRKYFKESEISQFIKHVDNDGNNLLFNAVKRNMIVIVELTWYEIKSFLTHDEQIEYLKMKGINGKNLLECSLDNKLFKEEVNAWVKTQMKHYKINI